MAPQPVVDNAATTRRTHIIRTVLAVLVIAPLSIAAFYMWALWDPGDTVNRLPVAIVNADAGTELDGTRLQAGDEVVAALVESGDVAWKVVSEQEAADGVNDGTYYFSVVIPKTFSADVASAASGSGRKAELDVLYNDYNSLVAGPVGESIIAQVRSAVSESIGEQSIDQVLVGLGELGTGFGEAAAGAQQLSDGSSEALAGTNELYARKQGTRHRHGRSKSGRQGAGRRSRRAGCWSERSCCRLRRAEQRTQPVGRGHRRTRRRRPTDQRSGRHGHHPGTRPRGVLGRRRRSDRRPHVDASKLGRSGLPPGSSKPWVDCGLP